MAVRNERQRLTEYPNFADLGLGTTSVRELYLPQSLAVSGLIVQLSNLPRWLYVACIAP